MKRKLFLMVAIVAMLACLFAITASAATIYKTADGTELFRYVDEDANYVFESYEGSFPKTDSDGNALTWYITNETTEDTDTVRTVASFITIDETGVYATLSNGSYNYTSAVSYSKVVSANFPDDSGITKLAFNNGNGFGAYAENAKKAEILYLYLPNTLTALPTRICQATPVLACEFDSEVLYTEISGVAFWYAQNLRKIEIPEGITEIVGEQNSNNGAFRHSISLTYVKFPNSLLSVGHRAFWGCTCIETIVLGANLTTFAGQSIFNGADALKYVYMPNTITTVSNSHTFYSGKNVTFFFTGTLEEFETIKALFTAKGNNGQLTNATVEAYDSSIDYTTYADNNGKDYVIYNYNICDAFYNGEHNDVGNACVIDCERCDSYDGQMKENPAHSFTTTITYADGFDKVGVKYELCSNEGCQYCEAAKETEVPAILFGYNGFSVPEDASYKGITFGYDIDKTALSEYEKYNSKLEMGFVVAVNAYLNGDDPLEADGSVALDTGVIKATFANEDTQGSYNRVDFVLKGDIWDVSIDIDGDEVLDTKVSDVEFLMCAYVIENGNVSYINKDVTSYSAELAKQAN